MSILFKGNIMKYFKLFISICIIITNSSILFAYDTLSSVNGSVVKNGIIYTFGGKYLYNPNTGEGIRSLSGYIKEFDEMTHDSLRYIEFPNYDINNIDVDSKGNKYIFSGALNKDAVADFLETDFIRVIDHKMILSKISANNDTIFYNTVIPATDDIFTRMKLTSDGKLLFIASTQPRDQFNKNDKYYYTPDSIYIISDNAIQKKRCVSTQFHLGVDLYIGILSDDGKKIEYGTFWGCYGDDYPGVFDIADNGDIGLICFMNRSTTRGSDPSATLNGGFNCTSGAMQFALSAHDSLENEPNIYTDLSVFTISVLNLAESKVKYATYFNYGRIRDLKFDKNSDLYVSGWIRANNKGLPLGTYIAKVDYENPNNWKFKTLSPNDYLDTLYVAPKELTEDWYSISHTRDIFLQIDKSNNFYLCGNTMDKALPVTQNAHQSTFCDSLDMAIYKLDKDFNLEYCSYFGSKGYDDILSFQLGSRQNEIFMYCNSDDENFPANVITKNSKFNQYITEYTIGELGINDEKQNNKFTLYPNPCSDFINIEPELNSSKIEIYNSLGEKVAEYNQVQKLDISKYPSGIYTIKSGNKTKSFVKI